MNLDFIIDENFIVLCLITKLMPYDKNNSAEYYFLKENYSLELDEINNIPESYFSNIITNKTLLFLEKLKKRNYFKNKIIETKEYAHFVDMHWQEKKKIIEKFLKKLMKIELENSSKVYICHPHCSIGANYGNNIFYWGHWKGQEDYNYNLVYLVHELLHSIIPFKNCETKKEENIKHGVIELLADYELYSYLSNKSKLEEGHEYLSEMKLKIYPYWLEYKGLNKEDKAKIMKYDNINCQFIENNDLVKMNVFEFIDYLNTLETF